MYATYVERKESVQPNRASSGLRFLRVVDLCGGFRIRIVISEAEGKNGRPKPFFLPTPRPSGTIQVMPNLMPEITAILLAAVVALWAYFTFFLGPSLWMTKRRAFYFDLILAGIVYGWLLTRFVASGWLGKPENATTVEALAAAAQAIFAVALIVLTVLTVRANAKIAEETSVVARETETMAAAAVQQQQAATRPVLAFRIHPPDGETAPHEMEFVIEVFNVGAGSALDARVSYTGPFNFGEPTGYVQPCTIAAGEAATFSFKLDEESPMLDRSDPLKWPRTEEDAELIRESKALETVLAARLQGSPENERRGVVNRERLIRSNRYFADLTAHLAEQRDIGQIRADYRDLAGTVHVSTADLVIINPESRRAVEQKAAELAELPESHLGAFRPYWPGLMLGIIVRGPDTRPAGHRRRGDLSRP